MKRYRIVNRKRFIKALVTVTAVTVLSISAVSFGNCKTNYETVNFTVREGDTLWDIAELYADESIDVRKYIRDIKAYNNMETSELMPGDIILTPCKQ